jgi:hypothetical protein
MGKKLQDKHKKLLSDPKYRKAYMELEDEFIIAKALIQSCPLSFPYLPCQVIYLFMDVPQRLM